MIPNRDDRQAQHCQELFDVLMPALRYRAKSCGYALAVHGSMRRDIDLVAVAWRETATSSAHLFDAFFEVCKAILGEGCVKPDKEFEAKPCGRLGRNIYLTPNYGDGPYLDISIMPPLKQEVKVNEGGDNA